MRARPWLLSVLGAVALAIVGCNQSPFPDIDLERMIRQRKFLSYSKSDFFKDGRAMRSPPEGTVEHDRLTGDPRISQGLVASRAPEAAGTTTGAPEGAGFNGRATEATGTTNRYVEQIPIPVTRALVERGRERFDIFCATCHGVTGDGDSMVARSMPLRRPPSLVAADVRDMPAGRIFQVITHGYGLMRSYAQDLSVEERWATVAYVRALELRSAIALDRLPVAMRARAEKALP